MEEGRGRRDEHTIFVSLHMPSRLLYHYKNSNTNLRWLDGHTSKKEGINND